MSPSGTVLSLVGMPRTDRSAYRAATTERTDRHALARRDAAVRRVGSVTRTIGLGLVAAVAAVGIYVSRAVPGHSTSTGETTGTTTGPTSAGEPSSTPTTGATSGSSPTPSAGAPSATPTTGATSGSSPAPSGSLTPPTSPPVQTQQQAPVVSGST